MVRLEVRLKAKFSIGLVVGLMVSRVFNVRFFMVRLEDNVMMDLSLVVVLMLWLIVVAVVLVLVDRLVVDGSFVVNSLMVGGLMIDSLVVDGSFVVSMVARNLSVVAMVIFVVVCGMGTTVFVFTTEVVMVIKFTVVMVGRCNVARSVVVNGNQVQVLLIAVILVTIVLLLTVVHRVPVCAVKMAVVEKAGQLDVGVGRFFDVVLNIKLMFSSHAVLIASLKLLFLGHQVVSWLKRPDRGLEAMILTLVGFNSFVLLGGQQFGHWVVIVLSRLPGWGLELHKLAICTVVVLLSCDVTVGINCEQSILSSAAKGIPGLVDRGLVLWDRSAVARGLNWSRLMMDWGLHSFSTLVMNGLGLMVNRNNYCDLCGSWGRSRGWSRGRCHSGSRSNCRSWYGSFSWRRCRCGSRCWLLIMLLAKCMGNEFFLGDNVVRHRTGCMVRLLREVFIAGVIVLPLSVVSLHVMG